jgi:hypothetical protein
MRRRSERESCKEVDEEEVGGGAGRRMGGLRGGS